MLLLIPEISMNLTGFVKKQELTRAEPRPTASDKQKKRYRYLLEGWKEKCTQTNWKFQKLFQMSFLGKDQLIITFFNAK